MEDKVIKRDGSIENISFDKILARVKNLGNNELKVNYTSLVQKIIDRVYNNIHTSEIDELLAQQCASLSTRHPDYQTLAGRIGISNLHKRTPDTFFEAMSILYDFIDVHGENKSIINNELFNIARKLDNEIENIIDYQRDFDIDYFGLKTLERAYLMRANGEIIERPQHMWMRVAIGIHGDNFDKIKNTYELMSKKIFTHATPTLFNAGTPRQQLSSCYLLAMEDDSIDGIYNTLKDCAKISKWAGGIGLHIHNVRAAGTHINGTNGTSNGIVPMLRVFNNTARYVDQGGGRRNGSFAIYLSPWHSDIFDFLEMKKNHGDEEARARDLFYALWVPDLFMKRVKENETWSLMCPHICKGLADVYGDEFELLYNKYEKQGKFTKQVSARELWFKICDSQIETGTPYILYADACNRKSNQQNLGTIKSSNLCTEVVLYSDDKETAVCNLASIALSKFVKQSKYKFPQKPIIYSKPDCIYCKLAKNLLDKHSIEYIEYQISMDELKNQMRVQFNREIKTFPQIVCDNEYIGTYQDLSQLLSSYFDYEELHKVSKVATENLNKVIDINFYPTEKTRRSNFLHRPIGIGIQGLADTFALLNIPFHSEQARDINKNIFETIYHGSLEMSMELSKDRNIKIKQLHDGYISLSWKFKEDNNLPHYREYETIHEFTNDLLNEIKPIRQEMENICDEKKYWGAYSSFVGSPTSQGILQFDLWDKKVTNDRYDWVKLKEEIKTYGLRNSTLLAPMPTASTSQILGNNECFEPFTSNIYIRRTLAGEFVIINKHLIKELIDIDLWDEDIKNNIIAHDGSIQQLTSIPKFIRDKYKTVWEIPMKHILNMSADRGQFICQSQSNNLWMKDPDYKKLTAMHFYSWSLGLKTGIYYLRTQAKATAQQFTIDPSKKPIEEEDCLMCGS